MIRSVVTILSVTLFVLAAGTSANATTIDYHVNFSVGAGNVLGDIFTDGTLGALTQSNITNWVLTINDGTDPVVTLDGPLSGNNSHVGLNLFADTVDPLNATALQLTWRFDQTPPPDGAQGFVFSGNNPGPTNGYRFDFFNSTGGGCCQAPEVDIAGPTIQLAQHVTPNGTTEVIGQVAAAATVPEPATLTLTALGLAGVARRYRRKSR